MSSSLTETDPGTLLLTVLDNVGLAVGVVNEQGKFVFANKKALTMWGEHSVVPGRSFVQWRSSYRVQDRHGQDIPPEKAPILRVLAGENVEPQDLRVIFPDGSVKWMHMISERFSVFGITGFLIVMADETEQELSRRSLQQFEQIESLGQLTRGMIHDLNNMFSVVSENLHLARLDEDVPQFTRERLEQIDVALKKGVGLVKKIGQFSRAQELSSQPIVINEAVNTALELAQPLFRGRLRVKLALDPDLPMVEGDSGEIEQALVNLILNAVDAMPNGGELSLSTERVLREASGKSGEKPASFVLITVADTGVGIPENIQPRIFEPFFTTKTEKRGTGLGLPSVYGIVQHHNGEIQVHSVPGQGTRFTIYLPLSAHTSAVYQHPEAV
jgi:two-component system cell cycle sensor histidine kinase/response regulator CckA